MFKGRKGKALAAEMGGNKVKTFVPGAGLAQAAAAQVPAGAQANTTAPGRPKQDVDAIKVSEYGLD